MIPFGEPVLETNQLCKSFGSVQAVSQLSFTVKAGEIYGFLGLNGAGKTTTIRMLLGLVKPDFGQVKLFGQDLVTAGVSPLGRIGSLVESATAYPNLTVRENLELQCRLTGTPSAAIDESIAQLQLQAYAQRPAGQLSLGNKQRLALARALVHKPDFLILDEPVNGLDPAGIVEIRALLRRLVAERGVAILMSSHLLDEVEQVADRIGIIHQGKMIDQFARSELSGKAEPSLELAVDDNTAAIRLIQTQIPTATIAQADDGSLRLKGPQDDLDPVRISHLVVGAGIGLRCIKAVTMDLESLFLGLTGAKS